MSELRAKAYEMVDKYFDAGGDPDCILMSQKDFRNSPAYKAELERVIEGDEPVYQIGKWGHGERVKGYAEKVVRNKLRAEQRKRARL